MSSSKRKKIEEYHDPDYCQDETKKLKTDAETNADRQEKIKAIIKREFLKEINAKEQQISLIDHKLTQTKRLLQRVRYAVVMSYYTKKNLEYSANEVKCEDSTRDTIISNLGQQTAIHPSLKKLLGKKPVDYEEILKSRSPRNAAKTARSTLIKPKKNEKKRTANDTTINEMKVPRYVSPIKSEVLIEKINSARGRNRTSHLIVVGNTSKYIGDEKSVNEVTHKWLVYIKTKTAVSIEDMVSKVRFFLHPSYKPNDVIEVDSPPFQISRRGWGEFPIRVQLYFHDSVNQKPLQIYHNLILDKKLTGLQTMGAETVVEIWLDLPIPKNATIQSRKTVRDSDVKSVSNSPEKSSFSKASYTLPTKHLSNDIGQKEEHVKVAMNIKKEECLIINDTPEIQSQEVIFENDENPSKTAISNHTSRTNRLKTQSIAQGCLNEISDIFRDTTPTQTVPVVKTATEKPKLAAVQPKKTLVKCLDSNGKLVFVEMQVVPNNPKNIKFIKSPNLITSTQPGSLNHLNQSKAQSVSTQSSSPLQQIQTRPLSNILSSTSNISILPKQSIQADPIATTIINQKPLIFERNSGLSRSDLNQTQQLIENKKFYLIQSSSLLNVNSTNPPPLVRISNPIQPTIAPTTTAIKNIQNTPKATETRKLTINSSNVVLKNGQVIILDRQKSHIKPKQESLLKPQISLLKPRPNQPICNKSTASKTTSANSTQMPLTQLISSSRLYRKQVPTNEIITKRDYHKEFSSAFLRHRFQSVRSAVEYLLRNAPLINTLSSKSDFSAAFPFTVESHRKFNDFLLPKRRSNEWYRAKWLIRMLQQHPDLKDQPCWLPKEIIIFSRRFGYTPTIIDKNLNDKLDNQNPLTDLIKRHIKDEQSNVTITFNNRMNDFIQRYDELTNKYSLETNNSPSEFIDVDSDILPTKFKLKTEPLPEVNGQKLVLDVSKIMQPDGMSVSDICRDIQIQLQHEEIVEGVLCSSSQLMLWQAMRSFLEDLIRRSFASKPVAQQTSDLSTERSVRVDDLKKTILATDHFVFLSNKHLGRRSS